MKLALLVLLLTAQILEVCPNPYGSDDAEYVKFYCNSSCVLTDGEGKVEAGKGLHVAARNPEEFERHFGAKADIQLPRSLALSNRGEEICVNEDCFRYGRDIRVLDDGVVYYRTSGGWDFRYEDWTNFTCITENVKGRLIITPADFNLGDGWIVASYTFSSPIRPAKLYVDGNPPSLPCRELKISPAVFLSSSSYRHFHYKFAIRGDRVVITTENWQFTNKGYIVEFESKNVSTALHNLLKNDERYAGKNPEYCSEWRYRKGEGGRALNFRANLTLFILPDCNPVLDFISSAKNRLYIIAPYMNLKWYSDHGILNAIKKAKVNGSRVRIFLDERYADDKTLKILKEEGVDITLLKNLHGKAVVSDDRVLITSANMNMFGLKLNREIGIIISSKKVSDFVVNDIESGSGTVILPDLIISLTAFVSSAAIFIRFRMKDKL
ncbi:phospholipase D-like domain-containing protein [Archaeoglobus neptunius]|uniref:phospholipase D-like domain-containing protein n=1 Tax=Archaeoglobus neptunius TaxID=2798580 RepID=UPI00192689ED|nr:phospholipase D family protein [Archaeoglobus neptunius]